MKSNKVNEELKMPLTADLERALSELIDGDSDVTIAMTDLDSFMRVNDTYGTDEGDRVLIETGRMLLEKLPSGTRTFRYGGDEFATIFPAGVEKEEVFLLMENLRREYPVTLPGGEPVTISIGIATAPNDGSSWVELVRAAEGAMFRGKLNGHNRVCLAREDKMVTKTTHYTVEQLKRLTKVSQREGIGEAMLLREALDALLKKYDG